MSNAGGSWFYRVGQQVVGPLEYAEIRRRADSRHLVATDLVSTDGQRWTLAAQMPGLADAYAGGPMSLAAAALQYQGRTMEVTLSAQSVGLLRQTVPWMMTFSIIVLVLAGLMFIAVLFVLGAGMVSKQPEFLIEGVFVLVGALLYTASGSYLLRYSRFLSTALATETPGTMERALEAQKAFWRLVTMMLILGVSLYVLLFIGALILGGPAPAVRHI